jgi:[protein-PII] uridylyltransferase
VTVDTSLLESRLVAGDAGVLLELDARLRARRDVRAFFEAKFQRAEAPPRALHGGGLQPRAQHQGKPGGLRDLQMVIWLARAAGFGSSWQRSRRGTSSRATRRWASR